MFICAPQNAIVSISLRGRFKDAGNKKNIASTWKTLGAELDLEPSVPLNGNVYLGCGQNDITIAQQDVEAKAAVFKDIFENPSGGKPPAEPTDSPTSKCGGQVERPAKKKKKKKKLAATGLTANTPQSKPRAWEYDMCGHALQCVEKYLELANKDVSTLKAVPTPCVDDHLLAPEDFQTKGELSLVAARVVKGIIFGKNWTGRCTMDSKHAGQRSDKMECSM